jgi:tripartite-type tricarboxylate transporter receptor subunit TctC
VKRLGGILIALCALPYGYTTAQTQSYPSRQVTIVVAYPAGGATDIIARPVAQRLSDIWGQPVVVENRPGANTQIAASFVAKARPDGYTLLATGAPTFINPYLYGNLPYDPASDFVPATGLGVLHQALVVHPSFPARNLAEFIKLTKTDPGAFNYATFGIGSTSHVSMELFESMTGTKLTPVHYKGGAQALTDVIGGHVPTTFLSLTLTAEPSKAGQLRILGVGGARRVTQFPDLPAIAETVPGYESSTWFGLFAPRGTPQGIVASINADVQKILTDPEFSEAFLKPSFYEPLLGPPDEFAHFVQAETVKWGAVMQNAKLSPQSPDSERTIPAKEN